MTAHEFIEKRIEELKRRIQQDRECIEEHQHHIREFSRAVSEELDEVMELEKLAEGARAPSSQDIKVIINRRPALHIQGRSI